MVMVQLWFMKKKVNEYYLFLNQGLSNNAVIRKNQRPHDKS